MTTCTRILEIDAGHRLLKHEGKCRHVHGHRYRFEITCSAMLDDVGRVLDFSVIKEVIGGWLDETIDHGFIAQDGDPIIEWLTAQGMKMCVVNFSPTAENLAEWVLTRANQLLADRWIKVTRVVCHETPNSWATATLENA